MPRPLAITLFIVVLLAVVGGGHYYLWVRLIRDAHLGKRARAGLTGALIVLALSGPLVLPLSRRLPSHVADWMLIPALTWMGVAFLLLMSVLFVDVARFFALKIHSARAASMPINPERRMVLARLVGICAAVLGFGASGVALVAARRLCVQRVEVWLPHLPAALDGITIVQLTDVHIGPSIGRDFIENVVGKVNALQADVVAITGDLVDGSVDALGPAAAPLAGLESRFGTFFVTGNHEYYSGVEPWLKKLKQLGIRVLRNERVSLGDARGSFDLVGIDDYAAHRFGRGHGADLKSAVAGRAANRASVLLAHQPRALEAAIEHEIGLQISGHTHGGQLWPFGWLVRLQQPVVAGLKRFGNTHIYVSRGTGYWGPPMRLAAPPEIAQIVLRSPLGYGEGAPSSARRSTKCLSLPRATS